VLWTWERVYAQEMSPPRKPYPSDVTDEEWAFVAPYLTLMDEDAPQRRYPLREVFNALRWLVRTGSPWRYLPNDLPPWAAVYQQTQRWLAAECFEAMADDLRVLLREAAGRDPQPTAVISDGRTLQATPESGHRAGFDGHKMRNGSKLHAAVDTLGHLLAARVTPANQQERAQVAALAAEVQQVTGNTVEVALVDQGYTGPDPAEAADAHGIDLVVVRLPAAKRGFVLLPRRWVIERSFAWATRFRRLAKDYERLPETVVGLHFVAFACLMLHRAISLLGPSP
jgi:transposase